MELQPGLSDLCQCGCRGWCSVWPLLEAFRADVSAKHSDLRLAVVDYKADWPALVEVAGLRTWSHNEHCCPCCRCDKSQLDEVAQWTLRTCPYESFSDEDYRTYVRENFKDSAWALGVIDLLVTWAKLGDCRYDLIGNKLCRF